jgi:death-on-curing protein
MKWINQDTVLEIHCRVIECTGGSHGVRDKNALESVLYTPLATFDKQELYPSSICMLRVNEYRLRNV